MARPRFSLSRVFPVVFGIVTALALVAPRSAAAQPFGAWLLLNGTNGYVEVPSAPALNPTSGITIEAWVDVSDANSGECSSIIGKDWLNSYWVGICGHTLRSYLRGGVTDRRDGGTLSGSEWDHIAVTWDGTTRKHYINGELVGSWPESAPLTTSSAPLRIGSDVSWEYTPNGSINEVRLWNRALSQEEIRYWINKPITSPQPGLVAVWSLSANANDALGTYNGTLQGNALYWTYAAVLDCGSGSATSLCLQGHLLVSVEWRDFSGNTGVGTVVGGSNTAGVFWFFEPDNWEMLVKIKNACAGYGHYWVFSAATTTVYYRVSVFDVSAGKRRLYFNYPHEPAVGIVDTSSFTCP